MIPRPRVPKLFDHSEADGRTIQQNVDVFGEPYTETSTYLPKTPGLLHAATEVSIIASEVYTYNALPPDQKDKANDSTTRVGFYERLKKLRDGLPDMFRHDYNFTPQTCLLRCESAYISNLALFNLNSSSHFADVVTSILNPLDPEMVVALEEMNVKELIIQFCRHEVERGERFLKLWPHAGHGVVGRGQFLALVSLVPFLEDENIHRMFASGCNSLHHCTRWVPALRTLLCTIEAVAWRMNKKIPSFALPYFRDLEVVADVRDLPTSFVLPPLKDLLADTYEDQDHGDHSKSGNEISRLIARWSALTVNS